MARNSMLGMLLIVLSSSQALAGDDHQSCTKEEAAPGEHPLTKDELKKVADYVALRIRGAKEAPPVAQLGMEIHDKLGIAVPASERARIKAAVVTPLCQRE
jgi:hypothetical protein